MARTRGQLRRYGESWSSTPVHPWIFVSRTEGVCIGSELCRVPLEKRWKPVCDDRVVQQWRSQDMEQLRSLSAESLEAERFIKRGPIQQNDRVIRTDDTRHTVARCFDAGPTISRLLPMLVERRVSRIQRYEPRARGTARVEPCCNVSLVLRVQVWSRPMSISVRSDFNGG
jgi:hypothetical protein